MDVFDTVVVGAGQAGLAISYFLKQDRRRYVVFERGRVGETWLSQRWDSFKLNTPNDMSVLPGLPYSGSEPDGFERVQDLVEYFQRYVENFNLPVRTGISVESLSQSADGKHFSLITRGEGGQTNTVTASSVVVANGVQRIPRIPQVHSSIPDDVFQIHTCNYRSPASLPPGAVVVVGSGQSGCQIIEDLLTAGRSVYLCTSKVGRTPRRYRGRDILEWMTDLGLLDIAYENLADKAISLAPQPQVSGLGRYGHTVSLQWLAESGAVILGRLLDVDGRKLVIGEDGAENVRFADMFSQKLKDDIDAYLRDSGLDLPPNADDPADLPDEECACLSTLQELDLDHTGVRTIIWATGFTGDFSWIQVPVLDELGNPIHERGISPQRGIYFLGFPWLHKRKSGIIYGIEEDARFLAERIADQLG